jgi:hypothetical protein
VRTDGHKTQLIFAFGNFANASSEMRVLSRPGKTWRPRQDIRLNKNTGAVHTRFVPQSRGRHCSADLPCLALRWVYRGQHSDVG